MTNKKIRCIAAIDSNRGIATKKGIPWHLPIDISYFRSKTKDSNILMGYNTYLELKHPLPDRQNFVFCRPGTELSEGFYAVYKLNNFMTKFNQDIWIIGGAALFQKTIKYADELYLTQIDKGFRCSKKFPVYVPGFRRIGQSPDHHQNTLTFRFEVWERLKN